MIERELKLRQAQLRMELRDLEVEIEKTRREQQFYKRLGFGRELQDVQMAELTEQRRACAARLQDLERRTRQRGGVSVLSLVAFSPLFLLMGLQTVFGRVLRTASAAR